MQISEIFQPHNEPNTALPVHKKKKTPQPEKATGF